VDCGLVPGTGGRNLADSCGAKHCGFLAWLPSRASAVLGVVEVNPPYDTAGMTSLFGMRVVVDTLGSLVAHGKLGSHRALIDKPISY
jgi:agmatinase